MRILVLIVDAILWIDRLFQRRIASVVSEYDSLRTDPESVLARREIVIGPRRAYLQAVLMGCFAGLIIPLGFAFHNLGNPRVGPPDTQTLVIVIGSVIAGPAIGTLCFWHWLRGGTVSLRKDGVVFRYRRDSVFCPWRIFCSSETGEIRSAERWLVPVCPETIVGVVHCRAKEVVAVGESIKTKPVTFRSNCCMVVRNLYCVRLNELAGLLVWLGQELGSEQVYVKSVRPGSPVPDLLT